MQALPPPPCQCPAVTTTSLYAHALLPPTWPAPTWSSPAWALTDSRAHLASTLPHCLHPPTTPSTSHRLLASYPSGRSCQSVSSYANCDFSCTARAIRRGPIDPWHLHQCHHRALHLGHCPHHCQGHRGCCQDMNVLRPSLESMSVPRWMPSPPTCRGQVLPPRLLHQSFRPRSSPTSTLRWRCPKHPVTRLCRPRTRVHSLRPLRVQVLLKLQRYTLDDHFLTTLFPTCSRLRIK